MHSDLRGRGADAFAALLQGLPGPTSSAKGASSERKPIETTPIARQVGEADLAALTTRFETAATQAGCRVLRASAASLAAAVAELVHDHAVRSALLHADIPPDRRMPIAAALSAAGCVVTERQDDDTLFAVDAAITGVVAAVAESGSLVWRSSATAARGATLIPPIHIAVVDAPALLPDLVDYFDKLAAGELPANVNLITGPSKTADIEGTLITGVHGPGVVAIVLVDA